MAGRNLQAIGAAAFDGDRLRSGGTWLVEFGATWCPPCRVVEPVLSTLAVRHAGKLSVAQVDADEESELSVTFDVRALPTMLVFRDGVLVDRVVGAVPEARLEKLVGPHLH